MNDTKRLKQIPNKFKDVSAVTFSTRGTDLMICFDGFADEGDAKEFADFLFAKIKMNYMNSDKIPEFH